MGDYSPHVLELAREAVAEHGEHISGLVLDATRPDDTLGFLRYKVFLVYISNVYDNLPDRRDRSHRRRTYQVETRAYLPGRSGRAHRATASASDPATLPELVDKLLRLGPDAAGRRLAATASPTARRRRRLLAAAAGRRCGWTSATCRCRPSTPTTIAPGVSGELLRPIIESPAATCACTCSNGAAASFADTLPLLHPSAVLQCHDLFVTDAAPVPTDFRGPGKYDGSVVNWVNGPLLAASAARGLRRRASPRSASARRNIAHR